MRLNATSNIARPPASADASIQEASRARGLVEIMKRCDGPTQDQALGASRSLLAAVTKARVENVEKAAARPWRFTQEVLPTRTELHDMGLPAPHFRNILRTMRDAGRMPAVPGPLLRNYQAHAKLLDQQRNASPQQLPDTLNVVNRFSETLHRLVNGPNRGVSERLLDGPSQNPVIQTLQVLKGEEGKPVKFGIKTLRGKPFFGSVGHNIEYSGMLRNGSRHGIGFAVSDDAIAEGEFVNGKIVRGIMTMVDGRRFEGQFKGVGLERVAGAKLHGQGWYLLPDGTICEGAFADGIPHGIVSYTLPVGIRYVGEMVMGKSHGFGVYTAADGTRLEGNFADGKFAGAR